MTRWAWSKAVTATLACAASAAAELPQIVVPGAPTAIPQSVGTDGPRIGDILLYRAPGQPERHVRILRQSPTARGESLFLVRDESSKAQYWLPSKMLTPVATPAVTKHNKQETTPARAYPSRRTKQTNSTPKKEHQKGAVLILHTAGQPDRQVRVLRVTVGADGERMADLQDLSNGARYSIPAKALLPALELAKPTPASVVHAAKPTAPPEVVKPSPPPAQTAFVVHWSTVTPAAAPAPPAPKPVAPAPSPDKITKLDWHPVTSPDELPNP